MCCMGCLAAGGLEGGGGEGDGGVVGRPQRYGPRMLPFGPGGGGVTVRAGGPCELGWLGGGGGGNHGVKF